MSDITSKDSKSFHFNVLGCKNLTFRHVNITAPQDSPNTDGIHIGRSVGINVINTKIGTGDDCISLGDGSQQVTITNVTCAPGHGISVGSLGRYVGETPVQGVRAKNCTLINTTNGVRIKTRPSSPSFGVASDIHFEDIIMVNVINPLVIDQEYCPWNQCDKKVLKSSFFFIFLFCINYNEFGRVLNLKTNVCLFFSFSRTHQKLRLAMLAL